VWGEVHEAQVEDGQLPLPLERVERLVGEVVAREGDVGDAERIGALRQRLAERGGSNPFLHCHQMGLLRRPLHDGDGVVHQAAKEGREAVRVVERGERRVKDLVGLADRPLFAAASSAYTTRHHQTLGGRMPKRTTKTTKKTSKAGHSSQTNKRSKVDALERDALALPKSEVRRSTLEPELAKKNSLVGIKAIDARRAALKKDHPGFRYDELVTVPLLADRVRDTVAAFELAKPGARGLKAKLSTIASSRQVMLPLAVAFARAGTIDQKVVGRIEKGSGPKDMVQDVRSLAGVLAPVRSNLPASTRALIDEAEALADTVAPLLGVADQDDAEAKRLADLRDRYATLLQKRHERLRAAVAALYSMDEVDTLAPSLTRGRPRMSKAKDKAEEVEAGTGEA
jgi:hypothetical protein